MCNDRWGAASCFGWLLAAQTMRRLMGWILAGLSAGAERVLGWEQGAVPTVLPRFESTGWNYKGSLLIRVTQLR